MRFFFLSFFVFVFCLFFVCFVLFVCLFVCMFFFVFVLFLNRKLHSLTNNVHGLVEICVCVQGGS